MIPRRSVIVELVVAIKGRISNTHAVWNKIITVIAKYTLIK